ncbi:MAG: TrkA family potassium uptake protein [Bradymonadaceae bacterium]
MAGEYAVIGIGRFGEALARRLTQLGQPVLAVDNRMERVQNEVAAAVCADATDEDALHELRLEAMTCVVVAIGSQATEASIMSTTLLAQFGVPRIVARANTQLHGRILRAVGAHDIVNPEYEIGERLARRLSQPNIVDQFQLGDSIVAEIAAPETFVGQTLAEIDLRNRFGLSVIAFQRAGDVHSNPRADDRVQDNDTLVVIGEAGAVDELSSLA